MSMHPDYLGMAVVAAFVVAGLLFCGPAWLLEWVRSWPSAWRRERPETRAARLAARRRHPSSRGRGRHLERIGAGERRRLNLDPEWRRIAEAEGLDEVLEAVMAEREAGL
jgi:hypothetical protein